MATTSVTSGQNQSGLIISSGATVNVLAGGRITSDTIQNGGAAVISSGGIDSGSTIQTGGTETVLGSATADNVSGAQNVSSGGIVTTETVFNGGVVTLLKGSSAATNLVVSSGGTLFVSSGTDSGSTILAGGNETIYGSANGDIIAGTQTVGNGSTSAPVSSGVITNETVLSGGVIMMAVKGTSATSITVDSGGVMHLNGAIVASNTVLSGGTLSLDSAKASTSGTLTFANGGTLDVTGNTSSGYGELAVISGFSAGSVIDVTSATTLGAATSFTSSFTSTTSTTTLTLSGGGVSDSFIFAGATIAPSLAVVSDGHGGEEIIVTSASTAPVISAGATQTVYGGSTVSGATVQSGGTLVVSSGGSDSTTTISAGGSETVFGTATSDIIAGTQTVASTGLVSNQTVLSGGTLTVSGTASNTTISGGTLNLATPQATLSGSVTFAGSGTLNVGAQSNAGAGDQAVISNFYYGDTVNLTTVGTGGTLTTTTSGGNTLATVTSGATSETLVFSGNVGSVLGLTSSGGTAEITYAPPTTTNYTPGDLVLSVYGNGAGTGVVNLDQAAPITLEEITTTGQIVSTQVLPETTSAVNGVTEYAISGEYESASEGILTLSADGRSMTIAGYGVNYASFDAANGATIYGTSALGQTTSVPGGQFTAVNRVVADIGYNGTVDTSTSLDDVFNTNNPRSVVTVNGTQFYLGGQSAGTDGNEGVFVAADGASSATAIWNDKTDVREVAINNGQLDVSVDSKLNGGAGLYDFGSTLPTSTTAPVAIPGIGASITLTAAEANSVNASAIGSVVNLSPEQYFYANATTLYIADGGVPKEGDLGDGGLQKWSLVNGTWVLDYTLSQGLNMIANTGTTGTTGLVGLTGTVVGGNVILYATNETVAETDPTYLYGITDQLAATTAPTGESFTLLETAAPGTLIRGVSFAPTSSGTTPEISATVSLTSGTTSAGLTVANGGSIVVQNGGTITGTTLLSGASATVSSGATETGTFVAQGASEQVLGSANGDIVGGLQTISTASAVVTNETIENGGTVDLYDPAATMNGTVVNSGATLNLSGGTEADNTLISGGTVVLQTADVTLGGALDFVGSGGSVIVDTVPQAGTGIIAVISGFGVGDVIDERAIGAGATLTTAVSGGNVVATVSSGSTVETLVFAGSAGVTGATYGANLSLVSDGLGGEEILYTPPAPVNVVVSGGVTSTGLPVTSGNSVTVMSGGTVSGLTVYAGGLASISAGGEDSGSVILNGGTELVLGDATSDSIYGVELVSGATATVENETVENGGTLELFLKPDVATNIVVLGGGSFLLSGNVSATNTVLSSGAYMALESPKAVFNGGLTFAGPATLAITGAISAGFGDVGGVISGWNAGDVIDFTLLAPGAVTSSVTSAGGFTTVTVSGGAYPESFTFAGDVTNHVAIVADGTGGSELVYVPAPAISGTVAGQTTVSEATLKPFSGVSITDPVSGATDVLTITVAGGGTLSGSGLSGGTGGVYSLTGTAGAVTSALDALVFTASAGTPNSSNTTSFTLSDQSSAFGFPTTDSTTTVIDTDPAVAPTISGTVAGQSTTSEATLTPFAGVTIADLNNAATDVLTITVAGGGTLSGTGLSGGTGGVYSLTGTASAVTSALDALVFTASAGTPHTNHTTSFTLSDQSSAFGSPTTDSTTTVTDTDPATPPLVTLAASPLATNLQTATLGTVTATTAGDSLAVTLTSDADFSTGSSISLKNGTLVYTPGLITAGTVGQDTITYKVTDTVTGLATTETQVVDLALPNLTVAANTAILVAANTQYQGGGNDQFYVTAATIADTINGGGNSSSLGVEGGGTSVMGANITGFSQVHLMGGTTGTTGFTFTANDTQNLTVYGSKGNDVITAGDASQTVITYGQHSVVEATAATAGVTVAGVGFNPTLEINGGGSATLNGNDGHGLVVQIDQAMVLNMGHATFISAVAETSGTTLIAAAPFQTLTSIAGGDTFIGDTGLNAYADTFQGTAAGLNADTIVNFGKSDVIDITDLLPTSGIVYTQGTGANAGQGTLSFGSASLTLQGSYNHNLFQLTSDGSTGTLVKYTG